MAVSCEADLIICISLHEGFSFSAFFPNRYAQLLKLEMPYHLFILTCLLPAVSSCTSEMERWVEDIRMAIDLAEQSSSLNNDLLSTSLSDNSKSSTVGLTLNVKLILLPAQTPHHHHICQDCGNQKINKISH